jgi:hypothetical protein
MAIIRRSIPEVPMDVSSQEEMRQFLLHLRQTVVDLRGTTTPPTPPTNFKATPLAVAVLLQWTRGINADGTEVLWSLTPNIGAATVIDAGSGNQHVDYVSNSTQKRYYWVRSYDAHSPARSIEVGPQSATPMASGSSVTPPTPPPSSQGITADSSTGRTVDRYNPHPRGQQ